MPKTSSIQSNFSAGELSSLLDGRVDISRYYNGAKTLENFITLPYGGIKRRPGTYYVASVKTAALKTRLVPFQFSTTQAYMVEIGDQYMRFYQNRGQILSGSSAYEISSPYLEAELFNLQFAQDADTMWIVHPSYKPRKLTRSAATWDSYTKLVLHCDGTDGSTTFTDSATSKVMTAVGNAQIDTAQYKFGGASGLLDGNGDYVTTPDHADWDFGTGDFTIDLRAEINALPAANSHAIIIAHSQNASNFWALSLERDASNNYKWHLYGYLANVQVIDFAAVCTVAVNTWYHIALVRNGNTFTLYQDGVSLGTSSISASMPDVTGLLYLGYIPAGWYAEGSYFNGWLDEIRVSKGIARWTANFTPPTSAYAAHIITFALNNYAPTADPFTSADNYPSSVSIHEQRICFANTNDDPQKVWASVAGNYENMTTGTAAADAYVYTIGSEQVNAIRWLNSGRVLGMGTLGGVFSMSGGADEVGITPTNVTVKRETTYGALGIVPKKIGNMVYYVQRNAKTLREFGYSYDVDEYKSDDTTILAEHITGNSIVDMDYQQSPYNLLWCVRGDGEIAVLTRQIEQEVLAWSRVVTDGLFESVAVIPGDGGDDEVWVVVKRTINNATVRYIEYFKPFNYGNEQEDAFFVDSGLSLDTAFTITDITQADPGVVTTEGAHGFSNGNIVIIRGVKGMTEVNRTKFKVANVTDTTFELTNASTGVNIDTSAYTAYTSAGEVRKCVTSVSGLSHLNGETLDVCADGVEGVASAVSGGAITITTPANGGGEIHAGLQFTSTLKTMRLEAGSAQGTAQSKLKRIQKVFAMIVDSYGMEMGNDDTMDTVSFSSDGLLFSGWKDITFPSLWDRDGYIKITQDKPLPLIILSIVIYLTTSDA